MRILIAPDKFKGSLDARAVAENIAIGLRDVLPQIEKILNVPRDGAISKEDVEQLNKLATEAVKAAMGATS